MKYSLTMDNDRMVIQWFSTPIAHSAAIECQDCHKRILSPWVIPYSTYHIVAALMVGTRHSTGDDTEKLVACNHKVSLFEQTVP